MSIKEKSNNKSKFYEYEQLIHNFANMNMHLVARWFTGSQRIRKLTFQ